MVRQLVVVLALVCVAALTWGCDTREDEGKLTFAVIPKADVFTFWPTVRGGAKAACDDLGIEMIWRGAKDETSSTDEIKIVDLMIGKKVDGIVLAPQDAKALVKIVEKAVDAGIPVVIIDSGLDSDKQVCFVATDNYQGGVMGAERLAEIIGGKGKVALIKNIEGSASTEQREAGFRETITGKYPDITLAAERHAMGNATEANKVVTTILAKHGDLAGVFTANEPGAIGAVNAVKKAGKTGQVKIVGFDASPELIAGIRAGVLDSTIVQDPHQMGYQGVKVLYDHLQGKTVEKTLRTPIKLVTQDNLDTEEIQKHLEAYGSSAKADE